MLNIAVLGCGRIGQMHARNIARHPRAKLATVFDIDVAAAERIGKELKPHETVVPKTDYTGKAAPYLNFFIERSAQAFSAEIDEFVSAVEEGRAPEVGFEDGRLALVLAEAAIKSAADGRVVRVSEVK